MAREVREARFKVQGRTVTVKAYDTVGVEDAYDILLRSALHRAMTGEDLGEPTSRKVKDWIIRTNLNI